MRIDLLGSNYYQIYRDGKFALQKGNCIDLLSTLEEKVDMVFADPPYFLSNNGLTIQSGEIVSVNKGDWDKLDTLDDIDAFNVKWLTKVKDVMTESATIWISGTMHNIFSIAKVLTDLEFKILNVITWEKSNPPPNFSCRSFTHSTELIIWARKSKSKAHYFNYELMKEINGNKQMKDVWRLPAIAPWEKVNGKHPVQKPLSVLVRTILSSTKPDDLILDPFCGSSTTGIAANLLGRRFIGMDLNNEYLEISLLRKKELEQQGMRNVFLEKIRGFENSKQLKQILDIQLSNNVI